MSTSWPNGSTWAWRKTRAQILDRDRHRCQLRLLGCTTHATQVHHTMAREAAGDNPAYLVAACRNCNNKVGDPRRAQDPTPTPRTRW